MSPEIGQKLGPYEILERAGKGDMATVYRARLPGLEREVANVLPDRMRAGHQLLWSRTASTNSQV